MGAAHIGGFVAIFVLLAVLLLSLNTVSLWQWWIKAAAVVVTSCFFAGSYLFAQALLGWPAGERPPERFNLLWTRVVEPNKVLDTEGIIYLWVEELDDRNVPMGTPRAYKLTYSDALAKNVLAAQERREGGEEVMGTLYEEEDRSEGSGEGEAPPEDQSQRGRQRIGQTNPDATPTTADDTVPFRDLDFGLRFEELPPVELPDKTPT